MFAKMRSEHLLAKIVKILFFPIYIEVKLIVCKHSLIFNKKR